MPLELRDQWGHFESSECDWIDHMLQMLNKLQPYTKLVSETVHWIFTSKFISDYFYVTIPYGGSFYNRDNKFSAVNLPENVSIGFFCLIDFVFSQWLQHLTLFHVFCGDFKVNESQYIALTVVSWSTILL